LPITCVMRVLPGFTFVSSASMKSEPEAGV